MSATLTPEIHQLIADMLVNDTTVADIVTALTTNSSFNVGHDDAIVLIARVKELREQALNMPVIGQSMQFKPAVGQVADVVPFTMKPEPVYLSVPVPDPLTVYPDSPQGIIEIDGLKIKIISTLKSGANVIVFEDILTDEECDHLINLGLPALQRSTVVNSEDGGNVVNPNRTSEGAYLARSQDDVVTAIERRLATLSGWPVENGEGLQVMRYAQGQEYKPHYDYFDPASSGSQALIEGPGQRVATFVLYLNTPENGGGTYFPQLGLSVYARKRAAVFFSYDRPSPDTKTLHGGAPVTSGEKWIATKWLRERPF